ncbi:MAG: hypothetical protein GF320_04070, partial [Armatimonadia bacterium]|nr:hypothetical protein [Armatimonadia bacterium]
MNRGWYRGFYFLWWYVGVTSWRWRMNLPRWVLAVTYQDQLLRLYCPWFDVAIDTRRPRKTKFMDPWFRETLR